MARNESLINLFPTLLILSKCVSASYPWQARLGAVTKSGMIKSDPGPTPDDVVQYYTQTIDHFNYRPESYQTFQHRFVLNSKYWGGANTSSPIFVYAGEESDITGDIPWVGFFTELASQFNGLQLFIEHRYYGDSIPFGPFELQNATTLGYFTSEQALADYAQVILDVKKNLSAESSPVIVVGGSYGGMLASWFRLKYPHIAIGALASSAPILYFDDITPHDGYYVVVSRDFQNTSENCYNTIRQSWSEINRVASQSNGLLTLGNTFGSCNPLNSTQELKDFLAIAYMASAQYDIAPHLFVEDMCDAIDGAVNGTYILTKIAPALNRSILAYGGQDSCYPISSSEINKAFGWYWQTCTEMVITMGLENNETMFESAVAPFNLTNYIERCQNAFGITPRPNWVPIEFGGRDIKMALGSFGSNIIFSNGLRDPYSSGGVLEDISDTIVAIKTEQGAHCVDLGNPAPNDPAWLVEQRNKESKIIAMWLAQYYSELSS